MNALQMSIAIARFFDTSKNIIVPNVSWGLGIHECDVLVVTKARYAIEVEIKTSKADIVADLKKQHGHESKKLRSLLFAIPKNLEHEHCIDLIPERAGIIIVYEHDHDHENNHRLYCSVLRKAKINMDAEKLNEKDVLHVARLGTMRIWNLREDIERLEADERRQNR